MPEGVNLKQRGRELAPIRNEAYKIYLATPDIKGKELHKLLLDKGHEVQVGTVNSWLARFKGGKKKEKEEKRAAPVAVAMQVPVRLTAADIADSLLKRVVEALNDHDYLLAEVTELRGWKERALDAEKSLAAERSEKGRILRLHNEQVKSGRLTSAKDLIKLARL